MSSMLGSISKVNFWALLQCRTFYRYYYTSDWGKYFNWKTCTIKNHTVWRDPL